MAKASLKITSGNVTNNEGLDGKRYKYKRISKVGSLINKVIEGDCLQKMKLIADMSIDLILCDLPYQVTNNSWDRGIDFAKLWEEYKRIIKPNGVVVLTSQGKFTGQVISSNFDWFKYKIVWIKQAATNFLNAKKQPLRKHEDICVFYKGKPTYTPQMMPGKPYDRGLRKDNKSGNYGYFGNWPIKNESGDRYPTDVLWIDDKIPDWIYFIAATKDGVFHPTQKPVELGRWLIRTYSKPGDLVLDNTCGSGSFLVSAILEGRNFIGIEKNENCMYMGKPVNYIHICEIRIEKARAERGTSLSI